MKIALTLILTVFFHLSIFSQINEQISSITPQGEELENVEYELIGGSNNDPLVVGDIVIPFKGDNFLNGVSTFDLVLIAKHILNTSPFQEDWQKIAADVNQNGVITILDMMIIQNAVFNSNFSLPNGNSWVFSPSQLNVDNDTDFPFEFLGIKLGDVNGTSIPMLNQDIVETRTLDGTLSFFAKDLFLKKGISYSIPVFSKNYKSIAGGQFTLEFNPQHIDFESIESNSLGGLNQDNFGLDNIASGLILSSWVNMENNDISEDEAFFNLKFTAKKDGQLSDFFTISSQKLEAEAYFENGQQFDFWDIQLDFGTEQIVNGLSVFPNPFSNETNFTIDIKESSKVVLDIFDATGKMVFTQTQTLSEGQNNITINQYNLSHSGIYFYNINTENDSYSGKIVLK